MKPCHHCNPPEGIRFGAFMIRFNNMDELGHYLQPVLICDTHHDEYGSSEYPIKYCPICNRDLKEEQS